MADKLKNTNGKKSNDLIKHKQNFDVIMDDTFIHSTAEEHMDDLLDLFKVP